MYYLRNPFKIFIYNIDKYIVVLHFQMLIKKKVYYFINKTIWGFNIGKIYRLLLFIICISFLLNIKQIYVKKNYSIIIGIIQSIVHKAPRQTDMYK